MSTNSDQIPLLCKLHAVTLGRGKLFLCLNTPHAMKRPGRTPTVFISRRSVVSFTFHPLYLQATSPGYPLHRRLGGPQNWYRHCAERKISTPSEKRTKMYWSPATSLLTIVIEPFRSFVHPNSTLLCINAHKIK
jgi:hypothetical protein